MREKRISAQSRRQKANQRCGSVSTDASAASEERTHRGFFPGSDPGTGRAPVGPGATLCVHARRFLPGGKRKRRTDERLTDGEGRDGRTDAWKRREERRASASKEGKRPRGPTGGRTRGNAVVLTESFRPEKVISAPEMHFRSVCPTVSRTLSRLKCTHKTHVNVVMPMPRFYNASPIRTGLYKSRFSSEYNTKLDFFQPFKMNMMSLGMRD